VTRKDIFNLTNKYFQENETDWTHCIGTSMDRARSMTKNYIGFLAEKKNCGTQQKESDKLNCDKFKLQTIAGIPLHLLYNCCH
jgi:hypothetical protein